MKACLALGFVAIDPGVYALARHSHRPGDMGFSPAGLIPVHDEQSAMERRTGITVGHENLRTVVDLDKPHLTRGFSSHQANTPATNVLSRYN